MVTGKYRLHRRKAAMKKAVVVIDMGASSAHADVFVGKPSIRVVKQSSVSTG
jgi:hypothetical protein